MKFSTLVKNKLDALDYSQISLRKSPPPSEPKPVEEREVKPEPAQVESWVRERLEKEFQSRLEMIRKDFADSMEQRTASREQEWKLREKQLEEKTQTLLNRVEEIEKANLELKSENQKLESSRQVSNRAVEDESLKLKDRLESVEREAAEKERKLREDLRREMEMEKSKIEERLREDFRNAAREMTAPLESKLREKENQILELQKALEHTAEKKQESKPEKTELPELPPKEVIRHESAPPALRADEALLKPSPPPVKKETSSPLRDSETLLGAPSGVSLSNLAAGSKEARKAYEILVKATNDFFKNSTEGKSLSFSTILPSVRGLIEVANKDEGDLISVFTEPYPSQDYFSYHAVNVAVLALLLGLDLQLQSEILEELVISALFHDIGMVKCPEGLDSPGPLSESLKKEVMEHPERGAAMIESCQPSEAILAGIRQHHELASGQGYPKGLHLEEIHLFAKIINISDSFEAMTHARSYRPQPMEVSQAVKEMIEKERGLYDRDVMKALISRVGLYPINSLVQLSNRQIARVLRQNRHFPLSPAIQIEFDEDGIKLREPIVMDLTKNQLIHINGPLNQLPTVSKVRIEKFKKEAPKKSSILSILQFIPFVLIVAVLGLLIYLVLKI